MASKQDRLACLYMKDFKRSLECHFGLLDQLFENKGLSYDIVADLKQHKEEECKDKIICLIEEANLNTFVKGLQNSNQTHLANFILKNGVRGKSEDIDEWPLSDDDIDEMRKRYASLVDEMHTQSLVDLLFTNECLSLKHKSEIESHRTPFEKNRKLLDIMLHRSVGQWKLFFQCLKQDHKHLSADLRQVDTTGSEELADTVVNFRNQFQSSLAQLNESSTTLNAMVSKFKSMEDNVRQESKQNESHIIDRCDEIRLSLDSYEKELLSENNKRTNEIIQSLKLKSGEIELLYAQMEKLKQALENACQTGSNAYVACSGKQLLSRAEHLIKTSSGSSLDQQVAVKHVKFLPFSGEAFGKIKIGQISTGDPTEKILLTLGLHTGPLTQQKICGINLEKRDTMNVIDSTPSEIWAESAACVVNNFLYAVGLGKGGARNEIWAWSANRDEWTRCADMTAGRLEHCVTSVGDNIYVLGGVNADEKTLDSILCYDIKSNKWNEAGKLCHAVYNAACVTYKHYVYVFGGGDKDKRSVKHVQVYDSTTRNVSLASNPMPAAYCLMRAVLWKSKALLIGIHTCYIYNFESSTWQERKRFKTDVEHFGLTLDDNTLYISGGGTWSDDNEWTCRADVKSLLVDDFISDNKEAEWKHHATLPTPALISAYSPVVVIK